MNENQDKNIEDTLLDELSTNHQFVPATIQDLMDACCPPGTTWKDNVVTGGINRLRGQGFGIRISRDKNAIGEVEVTYEWDPTYTSRQWQKKERKRKSFLPKTTTQPTPEPEQLAAPPVPIKPPVDQEAVERAAGFVFGFRTLSAERLVDLFNSEGKPISAKEAETLIFTAAKKYSKIKLNITAIAA